jgi:hypothetical protein
VLVALSAADPLPLPLGRCRVRAYSWQDIGGSWGRESQGLSRQESQWLVVPAEPG